MTDTPSTANQKSRDPVIQVATASCLPYRPWPAANDIPAVLQQIQQRYGAGLERRNLLQFLIRLQQEFGWIHPDAITWCVHQLSVPGTPRESRLSHAEIHGIIDFYSFLERTPCPPFHLYLSTNVTDQFAGQDQNLAFFRKLEERYPQRLKVTTTSCTGLCDQGPGALLNGYPIPMLDGSISQALEALIEEKISVRDFQAQCAQPQDNIRLRDSLLNRQITAGHAIRQAITRTPAQLLEELKHSKLRGRGGAGFSTAFKWETCQQANGARKAIICNADEGEPGTFKDRVLLQSHLDQVIDGMTIAGYTVGAQQGYIYLRHEYQFLLAHLEAAIEARYQQGLLGKNVLKHPGFDFDLVIQLGAGAYVCGEESALIESMEGKRGIPRIRPPYPAERGYLGMPTVVNNVETFCCITRIALHGGDAFANQSCDGSTGTKIHSVSGDCDQPGIYELPFNATINDLLRMAGAHHTQAVQVGGPSGKLIFPRDFNLELNFSQIASGGSFMVFDESRDLFAIVKNFTDFFHHESCGFCTPCRVGCGVLSEKLDKFSQAHASADDIEHLKEMMELMDVTSHCGLGQTAAHPVRFLLQEKPDFFSARTRRDSLLKIDIREHTTDARHAVSHIATPSSGVRTDDG